jgi:glycosyltransferase involved in cell wall biosynthesis
MNILHLEASTGWGGQEIRILREAEGMRERGHFVILAVAKGGALIEQARKAGFTVYEVQFKRQFWLFSLWKLLFILHRHKIDLVNTHSSLDSWLGGIAARLARKKIVRTRHLSTPIKAGFNSRVLYGGLSDFVVTTCASIVPMIVQQSGKKRELCRSIPTGVNPEKIQVSLEEIQTFRNEIGVLPTDLLVGTACFMRSWKGIDDLLKAADRLREIAGIKWVIIGGGHAERHKNYAKELKLDGIVHFTGHLDRPFPAIGALDIFALLSTAHEGVSQAILQAAFLGKPLIATKTGGLGEVCIHELTGFSVDSFSPEQIAQAVLSLKENESLRKKFGKNAKELVLEQFTLTHTLNEMERVYGACRENRN